MVDTSASQAGAFREDSILALQSLLAGLGAEDRVHLMAVDINAIPLTTGFVAPGGKEVAAAMTKLQNRVPLGSTDMFGAISAATASFEDRAGASRAAVYIGDGVSRANVVNSSEFSGLMQGLVAKKVSVSSLAIGPTRDVQLLATIANHTGGAVVMDSDEQTGQQAGQQLARAVQARVYWPTQAKFSAGITESYPQNLPPVRSDRDSVVVGVLKESGEQALSATFEVDGVVEEHKWQVTSEKSSLDFSFLPKLVELARADGGLKLPTMGSTGLREVAHVITTQADRIARLGSQALQSGDIDGAKTAVSAAIAHDPTNPTAVALHYG
jgi:hypothetical protein